MFYHDVQGKPSRNGLCNKLADLGSHKAGVYSEEIRVDDHTVREVYFFSDYPYVGTKFNKVFKLGLIERNVFKIEGGGH